MSEIDSGSTDTFFSQLGQPREKTLRDEFAMAAMQGILANGYAGEFSNCAMRAYAQADAMMEARKK